MHDPVFFGIEGGLGVMIFGVAAEIHRKPPELRKQFAGDGVDYAELVPLNEFAFIPVCVLRLQERRIAGAIAGQKAEAADVVR